MSGVAVEQMSSSISPGEIPLFLQRSFTASAPMSDVASPSPFSILRSLIPVRDCIHSSFVSTIFSKSLLERISGGTHPLTAVMAAVILVMARKVNKNNGREPN
jgi:hypothetical protein